MGLVLKTAPATEPVSLVEAKLHLRLDSGAIEDNLTPVQSIVPGAHGIGTYTGTVIDLLGYQALVALDAGVATGSAAVKLQHSDDNVTFSDVTDGAFTTVTSANDNAIQEQAYTGGKRYLRAYAAVTSASCDFGVSIIKSLPASTEDSLLNDLITSAREYCEKFQNRAYVTQAWNLWLGSFPGKDYIDIPLPPLQVPEVTAGAFAAGTVYRILTIGTTDFTLIGASANTVGIVFTATGAGSGSGTATASGIIKYYGTDDTEYSMSGADYFIDTVSEPGRIVLGYGKSWPATILRPANGICVTFICGYTVVPKAIKQAMLLLIGHWYENREALSDKDMKPVPMAVEAILWQERVL